MVKNLKPKKDKKKTTASSKMKNKEKKINKKYGKYMNLTQVS